MREKVLPAADIIIPNRFELSVLSGCSADNEDEIVTAARSLLKKGRTSVCVVTGIGIKQGIGAVAVSDSSAYCVETPFIDKTEIRLKLDLQSFVKIDRMPEMRTESIENVAIPVFCLDAFSVSAVIKIKTFLSIQEQKRKIIT